MRVLVLNAGSGLFRPAPVGRCCRSNKPQERWPAPRTEEEIASPSRDDPLFLQRQLHGRVSMLTSPPRSGVLS